jgi:hypothetical protein
LPSQSVSLLVPFLTIRKMPCLEGHAVGFAAEAVR